MSSLLRRFLDRQGLPSLPSFGRLFRPPSPDDDAPLTDGIPCVVALLFPLRSGTSARSISTNLPCMAELPVTGFGALSASAIAVATEEDDAATAPSWGSEPSGCAERRLDRRDSMNSILND